MLICPAGKELTYRLIVKNHSGDYKVYTAEGCRSCPHYNECVSCKKKTARSVQVSVVDYEREEMRQKLKTPEGKDLYALRQQTVERDFANIKSNMGLDRFSMSGKDGAKSEAWLGCITHNMMIYVRKVSVKALSTRITAKIKSLPVWLTAITRQVLNKDRFSFFVCGRAGLFVL